MNLQTAGRFVRGRHANVCDATLGDHSVAGFVLADKCTQGVHLTGDEIDGARSGLALVMGTAVDHQ